MNILLTYATYSGGTETAAMFLKDCLSSVGHSITVIPPLQITKDAVIASDCVILCSPSWDVDGKEGQPHEDYLPFIRNLPAMGISGKQFCVLGLGDSSYQHFCGAVDVFEEAIKNAGGVLKYPSLRIDGFFYDQNRHENDIKEWSTKFVT